MDNKNALVWESRNKLLQKPGVVVALNGNEAIFERGKQGLAAFITVHSGLFYN